MTNVTLICEECRKTARRPLTREAGSRGTHETASEPAMCPDGHGPMVREDGHRVARPGEFFRVEGESFTVKVSR